MRCVRCGMINPETAIYCQNCGWLVVGQPRATGSSSFPPYIPPAGSPLSTRPLHKETSLPVASQRAYRVTRRPLWRLAWVALALLVAVAGLAFFIANSPQPAASASQTLLTYCDALQRGEYQQAYEQWTSSVRQQLSEADFAYYYQSRRKVTSCVVSNVSVDNSSAMGTLSLTFADGSAVTATVLLVMEQGTWKIQGQNSLRPVYPQNVLPR
ncbi:MAG TPA: hypothetical protein VKB35_19020 [Ktedonobacteraceae bacterium]|nr:hypothetical protein [Ktedonobacteraceae bacterium]